MLSSFDEAHNLLDRAKACYGGELPPLRVLLPFPR